MAELVQATAQAAKEFVEALEVPARDGDSGFIQRLIFNGQQSSADLAAGQNGLHQQLQVQLWEQ